MLFFSLTTIAVGAAESFYTVFVMERFDGKFRNAPEAAFELALFGDAIVAMLGVVMFGGALVLLNRRGLHPTPLGVYISATLGGLYMTMPSLLYAATLTPPVALSWLWLLLFPIIAARLALRSVRGAALDRSPTPSASIPRPDCDPL
jgi:hypothetical protein